MAQLLILVNEPSDEDEQHVTNSSNDNSSNKKGKNKKYFNEITCNSLEEAQ